MQGTIPEAVKKRRFTVDEFHKMGEAGILSEDDRVELMDGEILEMSPIGWKHMWCVNALTMLLAGLARGRYVVSVQNPLTMGERGEPQPDLVMIKNVPVGRLPTPDNTLIVIEVSDSTLAYDRNIKLPRYAAAGVPEVWILHIQADSVEVHSGPGPNGHGKITTYGRKDQVTSATMPDLAFDVNEIPPSAEPEKV